MKKDPFQKVSLQFAMAEIYNLTVQDADKNSRRTGFGYGFHKWQLSIHLAKHFGLTFKECRDMLKELANRKLIELRNSRSHGLIEVCLNGFEGHTSIGDYFIQEVDPNSFEAQ
jgi:hypothetical protein